MASLGISERLCSRHGEHLCCGSRCTPSSGSDVNRQVIVAAAGSLVLGQNQECYGACFSPSQSLDGTLAAVRVWNTVRTAVCSLLPLQRVPVDPSAVLVWQALSTEC